MSAISTERLELEPELEPEEQELTLLLRLGFIVGAGVLAAFASSVPTLLRMCRGLPMSDVFEQWLVLAAVATPLTVMTVAVLRRARVGLRILVGEDATPLAIGALWAMIIELALLSAFGMLLRKATHHRALAGVTFAVVSVATGLFVVLLARRASELVVRRQSKQVQKVALIIVGLSVFVATAVVAVRMGRVHDLPTLKVLVDALAVFVSAALAASGYLFRLRWLSVVGIPLAVLVVMVGLTLLRFEPSLREALERSAPVHVFIIGLFGA